METFNWKVQRGSDGTETLTQRIAKFGDGYEQVIADGINDSVQSWPVVFIGRKSEVIAIRDFIRANNGKAFIWRNPLGEQTLYRCAEPSYRTNSKNFATFTGTFKQAFAP